MFGLAVVALVGALIYAVGHESPKPPTYATSAVPVGDAGSTTADAVADDAAPTSTSDAAAEPAATLYARTTIGDSWIDITAHGDLEVARRLCKAIVADEIRRGVADLKPAIARDCDLKELPAIAKKAGVLLIDTRNVTADDFLALDTPAANSTATIERISRFTSADACEKMRQRLVDKRKVDAAVPSPATKVLTDELDQARRDRDRDCRPVRGAPSPDPELCSRSKAKVDILERTLSRARVDSRKTAAPSTPPVCRPE
jgi:hypothetical protein